MTITVLLSVGILGILGYRAWRQRKQHDLSVTGIDQFEPPPVDTSPHVSDVIDTISDAVSNGDAPP